MAWIELIIAGLFEVFWATMMKLSSGFSKWNYTLLTVIGMLFSFVLLARALRSLPMSIAYPVWTGVGAVGSILVGAYFFKDQLTPAAWFFIILLMIALVGLKITSGH